MKFIYCSQCGFKSAIMRKAMPKYGVIIDVADPHVCADEPIELDLTSNPIPTESTMSEKKFVQKLNDLQPDPRAFSPLSEGSKLGDRRSADHIKQTSIAPRTILDQLQSMIPTDVPEGSIKDPEE
jgi:hypothetical protein